MDHGNVDHAAMGHEAGATDMAMPGDAAHGDHMALMDRDERRARWALYANIGLGLWLASSPLIYDSMTTQSVGESSEEHTSELQSLMRISYAVFCLKKKTHTKAPAKYNADAEHYTLQTPQQHAATYH